MKTKIFSIIAILLIFGFVSCNKQSNELNLKKIDVSTDTKKIIEANNQFGFDMLQKIISTDDADGNLMISPVSISLALAMTYNGADGATKDAMTQTLNLSGLSVDDINSSYKQFIADLISVDNDVELSIANSIWYRNSFYVEPDFISTNEDYYNAVVSALDFSAPSAVITINDWVADNTNDLITEIVEQIDPATVMYLINAIYFKGIWHYEFKESETSNQPFYLSSDDQIDVPTMSMKASLDYYSNEDFTAVKLPYGDGNYSMTLMLPYNENNPDSIIKKMDVDLWADMVDNFVNSNEINLFLPKFSFEYEKKLNEILKIMGMEVAFGGSADFTKINNDGGLYISEVKHKSFIEVNEEGTEAAAVTSVAVYFESTVNPQQMTVRFDKPFVFAITEVTTNTVVFIGKVENPLN